MAAKLTRSDRAGWLMALPGVGLIATFIIIPFFLAFGFSRTNQRLASPNPTEYVGFANYSDLLGLAIFTLEPERDDAGRAVVEDGEIQYPPPAPLYAQQPRLPQSARQAGMVQLAVGGKPHRGFGLGRGVHEGACEHGFLCSGRGPPAIGGGPMPGAFDQSETARHQRLSRDLLYARGGFDCGGLASLEIHLLAR